MRFISPLHHSIDRLGRYIVDLDMTVPLRKVRVEPDVYVVQCRQRGGSRISGHHCEHVKVAAARGEVTQRPRPMQSQAQKIVAQDLCNFRGESSKHLCWLCHPATIGARPAGISTRLGGLTGAPAHLTWTGPAAAVRAHEHLQTVSDREEATGTVRSNNRRRRRFALRRSQGRASHLDADRPDQSTSPATTPFEGDACRTSSLRAVSRLRRFRTRSRAGKASVRPASSPVRCCSASAATAALVR
jgi:hypothetical protein